MGKEIYLKANELLTSGQKLVLARIIRRSGSTPRDVGSMCIINQKGELFGTIGGGVMEYRVQKKSRQLLEQGRSYIYRFQLSNEELAQNGMICGGNVDIYLEPLSPENPETMSLFKAIKKNIDSNKSGTLLTRIEDNLRDLDTGTRLFWDEQGRIIGGIPGVDPQQFSLGKKISCQLIPLEEIGMTLFGEKIAPESRIFLFGAGHVSTFVARLAKMVEFNITVIDDRPDFANEQRFPAADNIVITDFENAFEQLHIEENAYILIITRGHLHDKIVLEKALSSKAAYIGMIGSIKKRDIIYKDLMESGISKEALQNIFSPIGLDIGAETPEEIAVSIVGELIKKRAENRKG